LFNSINGLLFPGGDTPLTDFSSQFMKTAHLFYLLAINANDNGDVFPLWGTCLGFQLLSVLAAGTPDVLCENCFDSENMPLPLNFTDIARSSRLFSRIPGSLMTSLSTEPVTPNFHSSGVFPHSFIDSTRLASVFNVLSTNFDRKWRRYASTIEGKQYPFYGVQFHPEKPSFEWVPEFDIPRSLHAIQIGQFFSDFFVNEARKSMHKFATNADEQNALIYNTPAVQDPEGYFDQVYVWSNVDQINFIEQSAL
jgi:gamma-glutamyl hydrolase